MLHLKLSLLTLSCIAFTITTNAQQKGITNNAQFQRDFANNKTVSATSYVMTVHAPQAIINYNEEKYRKFKKMRTGGIILTSVGAGLIVGGAALIAAGENERDDYYSVNSGEGKAIAGVFCILFGTLSTGGGITMWAIGNKKMKKYGGGSLSIKSTKAGVGLAYGL